MHGRLSRWLLLVGWCMQWLIKCATCIYCCMHVYVEMCDRSIDASTT
uniref:Uncharacterized protein n=1 Tax=Arundo donax TaxID=35708 RepID=A0A0A9B2W3_ARUDO